MSNYKVGINDKIVPDLTAKEYHAEPGITRSMISALKISLAHFCRVRDNQSLKEPTSAMKIGSIVHSLALNPSLFQKEFFIVPKIDRRTKEGKLYDKETEIILQGERERVYEEELKIAHDIALSLSKDKNFSEIMKGNILNEASIFYTCPDTNLLCKTRPDIWNKDRNIVCEVKTTNDFINFDRSVRAYDYHIQAAMQIEGLEIMSKTKIEDFYFVVVSTIPPHDVVTYKMDYETLAQGRQEMKDALTVISIAQEENQWNKDLETVRILTLKSFQRTNPFSHLLKAYHIYE